MNEIVNSAKELVEIEHEGQFFKGDPTVPFINQSLEHNLYHCICVKCVQYTLLNTDF